jgi:hypothetical protein
MRGQIRRYCKESGTFPLWIRINNLCLLDNCPYGNQLIGIEIYDDNKNFKICLSGGRKQNYKELEKEILEVPIFGLRLDLNKLKLGN